MLFGLLLSMCCAIISAFNAVLNRSLKETHTAVVIFFHTLGGLTAISTFMIIEAIIKGELMLATHPMNWNLIASGCALLDST